MSIAGHVAGRNCRGDRDYLAGDGARHAVRRQTGRRRIPAGHAHALHGIDCPFHGSSIRPDRLPRVYEMKSTVLASNFDRTKAIPKMGKPERKTAS
jgi:hypothetical protein